MGLVFTDLVVPALHWKFPIADGIFFFPTIFILDDIVTEVYGYAAARQMMWIGMATFLVLVLGTMLVMQLPYDAKWLPEEKAFDIVFLQLPRVFLSFVVGIFVGAIVNDFAMAKIKIYLGGRFFMLRSIGSSLVGALALQITGTTIALYGMMSYLHEVLPMMLVSYGYKLIFDLVGVVIAYPLQKTLKRAEGIDHYDINTNFNPFKFSIK